VTALETATRFVQRGWNPVPVSFKTKRPIGEEWEKRKITLDNVGAHFNGRPQNVGMQLGALSGGLTDVDLDCAEAVQAAPFFLPRTDAIFGRASRPASHYLFVTDIAETIDNAVVGFLDPTPGLREHKAMLVELRVGGGGKGAQTVGPGSVHESGEAIRWDRDGDPALCSGAVLQRAVRSIAAVSLLARHWPGDRGIEAALAIGGVLAKIGADASAAKRFVSTVLMICDCQEAEDLTRAACGVVEACARGEISDGMPSLTDVFSGPVAGKVAEWLGLQKRSEKPRATATGPKASGGAGNSFSWGQTPPRNQAWALGALEQEAAKLAEAAPGGRHFAARLAGFRMGQLVGGGILDRDHAYEVLEAAALKWGIPKTDKALGRKGTLATGIAAGMQNPRHGPKEDRAQAERAANDDVPPKGGEKRARAAKPGHNGDLLTEDWAARTFAERHTGELLFCHDTGRWQVVPPLVV
jgi:bifunctional DNA primase/polymerase-like protein